MRTVILIYRIIGVTTTLMCFVTGCHRLPEPATAGDVRNTICTFWRDDGNTAHLIGGGVFLKFDNRMFCLTARHVATMPSGNGSTGGFFLHPEQMILALENPQGCIGWRHGIASERWMTGDPKHDLTWFELTEDERCHVKAVGGLSIAATTNITKTAVDVLRMSGSSGFVSGAAAISIESWGCAGLTNNVSLLVFVGMSRVRKNMNGVQCVSSVTNFNSTLPKVTLENIMLKFDGHKNLTNLRTQQIVAGFKTEKGDSGMPVFATAQGASYPMLIGVISARKDQGTQSGVMPINEALRNILNANTRRLVEMDQLQ